MVCLLCSLNSISVPVEMLFSSTSLLWESHLCVSTAPAFPVSPSPTSSWWRCWGACWGQVRWLDAPLAYTPQTFLGQLSLSKLILSKCQRVRGCFYTLLLVIQQSGSLFELTWPWFGNPQSASLNFLSLPLLFIKVETCSSLLIGGTWIPTQGKGPVSMTFLPTELTQATSPWSAHVFHAASLIPMQRMTIA